MEGNGGNIKIDEIAPEVVNDTDETVTDAYINQMLLHKELDEEVVTHLGDHRGKCAERIDRLDMVSPEVEAFLEHVSVRFQGDERAQRRIREALSLMLKVHINQGNRIASGMPFVAHPIAVAERVLDMYEGEDASFVCVAALLHDSIEDQSRLLDLEKKMAHDEKYNVSEAVIMREGALNSLGHFFGMRSMSLIGRLTSPEVLKTDMPQDEKNEIYKEYVSLIFNNNLHDPATAVIKWADLQENAFIGDLYERAQKAKEAGDEEGYELAIGFYHKLKVKYHPVLLMVREFFENVEETHPLFKQREAAMKKIDDALENQYNLA